MTQAQWNEVKQAWGKPFSSISFEVDGYELTLQYHQENMKIYMLTFINGEMKLKWGSPVNGKSSGDTEPEWTDIARRFWQTHVKSPYKQKDIKRFERDFGKRYAKKRGLYNKIYYKSPLWRSFTSFKRHLIANNKDIKLITV